MSLPICFITFVQEDIDYAQKLSTDLIQSNLDIEFVLDTFSDPVKRKRAVEQADYVIFLLSYASISDDQFAKSEIKETIEILNLHPNHTKKIINLNINNCKINDELLKFGRVDFFDDYDYELLELLKAFKLNIAIQKQLTNHKVNHSESHLKFDGLYRSKEQEGEQINYWQYLRFYANGFVVSTSCSSSDTHRVSKWLTQQRAFFNSQGIYKVDKNSIAFNENQVNGIVKLNGIIGENTLVINHHSLISDNKETTEYTFVKIE